MGFRTGQIFSFLGAAALLTALPLGLSGCGNFFVCEGKASCPSSGTGGTGTTDGDYAYVSNSTGGTGDLSVYSVSSGSPVALAVSPLSMGFTPLSMVIAPKNAYLFAASATEIWAYTINSNGGLTNPNSGLGVMSATALAMDVTPDGSQLFALVTGISSPYLLQEFAIGTNGTLTLEGSFDVNSVTSISAQAVKVAPSGDFVVVAMGTSGDVIYPLINSMIPATASETVIAESSQAVADYAVAIDSTNNIYFARTGSVSVYSATSGGVPTPMNNTNTTNAQDYSIVLAGSYLYTGNFGGSVNGFSTNAGALASLTGSPYTGPGSASAIGVDNTGKYIVVAGAGSNGIMEYTIGSGGVLTASSTSAGSGSYSTTVPIVMALTK